MLTEAQIQRYSRQVLLREVGGRGQGKLLAHPFLVRGTGAALDVAVAYLAAGGTPLLGQAFERRGGFLDGAAAADFAPDALAVPGEAGHAPPGLLTTDPASLASAGPAVFLGGAGVAFRTAGACGACFACTAQSLPTHLAPGGEVALGAVAALVAQRLVLGMAEPVGAVFWTGERFSELPTWRCAAHAEP